MSFFILGINHKACPVEVREKLYFSATQVENMLEMSRAREEVSELVVVSTCNRVELYGFSEHAANVRECLLELLEEIHGIGREQFQDYLYFYQHKDAMRHLFRVSAGLDSLVIGENEILGQIRDSFRASHSAGTVHSLLYRLMEKALKAGKDVRAQTKINEGAVSIPSVAVELAGKVFGALRGEKIMVLGTGEMSLLALENLKNAGANITHVVSRDETRGRKVAEQFEAEWVSNHVWESYVEIADILIASTAAPHAIVHKEQIKAAMSKRRNRPLLIIDIAVPRNVASDVNDIDDVYVYNIDDLKGVSQANLRLRHKEVRKAEEMIEEAVINYQGWLERLKARPTLERFESYLNEVLTEELDRLSPEAALSTAQKDEMKHRIRAKLLHHPHQKITEASKNGGVMRYLEALHSLFDLDENKD